jgi:hypothetical protein
MAMTSNDEKRGFEAVFGKCEWRAEKDNKTMISKGWPTDKNHPANAPDSDYVIPCMDYLKIKGKK